MAWWDTDAGTPSSAQLRRLLWLDALYARVNAMTLPTTDHSPVAGGIGHDAGAAGSSSPSSSALAGAAPTAPASLSAIRDGGPSVRIPVPHSAVISHLSTGAGESRNEAPADAHNDAAPMLPTSEPLDLAG